MVKKGIAVVVLALMTGGCMVTSDGVLMRGALGPKEKPKFTWHVSVGASEMAAELPGVAEITARPTIESDSG